MEEQGPVHNNKVIQKPQNTTSIQRGISGINILTGTKIFNNLVVDAGYAGIWVHIRHVENEVLKDLEEELGYHFYNNTVVRARLNNTTELVFISALVSQAIKELWGAATALI